MLVLVGGEAIGGTPTERNVVLCMYWNYLVDPLRSRVSGFVTLGLVNN